MTKFVRIGGLLLTGVLGTPLAGVAQDQPDALRLFVEELLTDFIFVEGRPIIRVGTVASRVPPLSLTSADEVLGSIEYPTFSMTLLRSPNASDLVHGTRAHLRQGGWELKAREAASGFSVTPATVSAVLCSENSFLSIGSDGQGKVTIVEGSGELFISQCTVQSSTDAAGRPVSPLPSLDPPPAVTALGGRSSGGGNSWDYSTRLLTEWSPKELIDHYSWELTQVGASFGEASSTSQSAVAPFEWVDDHGIRWRGTMAIVVTAPDQRNVYLQLLTMQ